MFRYLGGFLAIFFLFSTSFTTLSFARHSAPLKFGKYKKKEIELKEVSYEPDAAAVMTYKYGRIEYRNGSIQINKHIRIKILKEEGIDYANVGIPYYSKDGYEKVYRIKAQTANFNNGKVEEIEVDKDNIFDVDVNENYSQIRFTFPDVKVGSIIEYKYTISSESLLTLDEWNFQSEIPVLHSEIFVGIPSGLDYQIVFSGHKMVEKYRNNSTNNWVLNNLRSLKEVPFLYNLDDYAEKIKFQLSGYQTRSVRGVSTYEKVLKSWDHFADQLLDGYKYRNYLNRNGLAKEISSQIDLKDKSQEDKIKSIFNFIRTNYTWNGEYHRVPEEKIQDMVEIKKGNSAAINLLLVLLLNEAGVEARPAMISTRSYGLITKNYPLLTQFIHVLCHVKLENDQYQLLDATHPFASVNYLPSEDLNHEAFVLDKRSPEWVKIKPYGKNIETVMVKTKLLEDNTSEMDINVMVDGLNALDARSGIYQNGVEKWLKNRIGIMVKEDLSDCEVENLDITDESLKISKKIGAEFNSAADMLYINPYFFLELKDNPLKSQERYYPVEFEYTYNFRFINYIEIPEGYMVIEMPDSERIRLPNGYGYFHYIIEHKQNNVNLSVNFMLSETSIPPNNYKVLREFYDIVASKLKQQVVLKKSQESSSNKK